MPNVTIHEDDVMVKLRNLRKSFGKQDVLLDVNLDIRRNETMVIIGQSGGGKSVILKHMIGLLQPDGGEVSVEGVTISTSKFFDTKTIRKKMGMLFQMGALFDSMD
ncbi:MAG: ATP-binding cassette domain-containing protein, partial [Fibromonadaceae bacterium]|nr:ATP-binding cassette domain-containing protein [Fibromonadaceae bacterium]